jgi:hypothetical protein
METTNNYQESVLLSNSMCITTDGKENVIIQAEIGTMAESIESILSDLGIEFLSYKYTKHLEVDDLDYQIVACMEFFLKIEDLKNYCPSLYDQLVGKNKDSQIVLQYITDNNLLNEYDLN